MFAGSDASTTSEHSRRSSAEHFNAAGSAEASSGLSQRSQSLRDRDGDAASPKSPTFTAVTQQLRNAPSPGVAGSPGMHAAIDGDSEVSLPQHVIDQISVRAEAQDSQDMETGQVVSMEVSNLPQRDGERCNIEFAFQVGVDSVRDIITEMQEELNLALGDADTELIEEKIDTELRRCGAAVL